MYFIFTSNLQSVSLDTILKVTNITLLTYFLCKGFLPVNY